MSDHTCEDRFVHGRDQLRKGFRALAALVLAAACASGAAAAPPRQFEAATFLSPQSDLTEPYPGMDLSVGIDRFENQTVRQVARIAVGGKALRIKFSNQFGTQPLTLDGVSMALSLGLGHIDPATMRRVTFAGRGAVTIAPGATVTSDAIAFAARPLSEIAVSIYMKNAPVRTAHRISRTTAYIGSGDLTGAASIPDPKKLTASFFMPEIVAIRPAKTRVLVALGDSITAYPGILDVPQSWPDQLAAMVDAAHDNVSVVNAGIGGNRWVRDNMGPCGTCRLSRDVLDIEGVTDVVMALGINDIGLGMRYSNGFKDPSQNVSSQQIIAAMQEAIARAKARGLRVYVATLVPFKGPMRDYYTTGAPDDLAYGSSVPHNGEKIRGEVNAFIRQNKLIDGVIDIDAKLADPADPLKQIKELTGDGLHPNHIGLRIFARLVYEKVFERHAK